MKRAWLVAIACITLAPEAARAHPLSFGVLTIEQAGDHSLTVELRFSGDEDSPDAAAPQLPALCTPIGFTQIEIPYGVRIIGRARCSAPLTGHAVGVRGLEPGETQVLVRVRLHDGREESTVLTADAASFTVPARHAVQRVLPTYLKLGVVHILEGVDHLMLVLGLLLLVRGTRKAVLTITAFTLGHSITLALATLHILELEAAPAEACIALSLVLLAVELLREDASSLGRRYPWMLAIAFGLLHGLGFAGALAEIGVPEDALALSLFGFNLGVEIGQLLFVCAAVLVGVVGTRVLTAERATYLRARVIPVMLGASATYFVLDRLANLGA